jgi:hypothetical protein
MASKWLAGFLQSGVVSAADGAVDPHIRRRVENVKNAKTPTREDFGNFGNFGTGAEHRSGISDRVITEWTEGILHMLSLSRPACIKSDRWRLIVADSHRFVDRWGTSAVALGWSTFDVFGEHATHPVERLDHAGVVLLLHGDEVVALTADSARIRTSSGTLLTYYRRPRSGAVLLWELR